MDRVRGAAAAFLSGAVAFLVSRLIPALDALFVALILGIILRGFLPQRIREGAEWSISLFIPLGIVAYSSNLPFEDFTRVPLYRIVEIFIIQGIFFSTLYYLGRRHRIRKKLTLLLASGSAVCGASAIAVISPLIKAKKSDTSVSIMVITAVGLTGAIVFPLLQVALNLSPESYSFLSGTTLHQVALVKIAAKSGESSDFALLFKGIRIATLIVVALIAQTLAHRGKMEIPWFMLVFIILGVVFSFVEGLQTLRVAFQPLSKLLFSTALASIGLSVELREILSARLRTLNLAYCAWLITVAIVLALEVMV